MPLSDSERNRLLDLSAAAWRGLKRHGLNAERIEGDYTRRLLACKTCEQTLGVIAELFCDGSFGEPLPFPENDCAEPDVVWAYNLMRDNWRDAKSMCLLAKNAPKPRRK